MGIGDFVKSIGGAVGVGSLLQGAGSVLGAFGVGKASSPDPGAAAITAANIGLDTERRSFEQKMELAQQHGIHPLSVLGVPMGNYQPSISFGGGSSSNVDFRDLGYGLNQAAQAFVKPPENLPTPVDPLAERMKDAQVRRAEAEAKLSELAVGKAWSGMLQTNAGSPPGVQSSNDVASMVAAQSGIPESWISGGGRSKGVVNVTQDVAPPHPKLPGYAAAANQGWDRIIDRDGKPVSMVRQDAVQADIEKGATFQALAQVLGIEDALKVTALLENEGLLVGGVAGAGYLAGKGFTRLFKLIKEMRQARHIERVKKPLSSRKGRIFTQP